MKKYISFLILAIILNLAVYGQQDPQYTQNMFYKLGVNPGYAGADNAINALVLNRYQWAGFEGAPKTLVFSVDAALDAIGAPGGLGINVVSDEIGFEKNTQVNLNYAYRTSLSMGDLGIGLALGVMNKSINGEWDIPENSLGIGTQPDSDPGIPKGEVSQIAFDMGFGLYLSSNKYYAGASVTHLNEPEIKFDETATGYLARHYYISGGYNIKLPDPLFELRPSFFFKSDAASWQLDLNANIVFDERFWGGVSYRIKDAVAFLFGMEIKNGLRFGYSFDLVTSSIRHYGFASHEVVVSYSLNLERNRNQKYKSIRFL